MTLLPFVVVPSVRHPSDHVSQARGIAAAVHQLSGWASPVDPRLQARAAGVTVASSAVLGTIAQLATADLVLFAPAANERETGLRIALGLAQALLVRARVPPSSAATALLAGELLAPPWLLWRGARIVAATHPWAPAAFVLAHHEASADR